MSDWTELLPSHRAVVLIAIKTMIEGAAEDANKPECTERLTARRKDVYGEITKAFVAAHTALVELAPLDKSHPTGPVVTQRLEEPPGHELLKVCVEVPKGVTLERGMPVYHPSPGAPNLTTKRCGEPWGGIAYSLDTDFAFTARVVEAFVERMPQ